MSSPANSPSPSRQPSAPPPLPHGGNNDPNQLRMRPGPSPSMSSQPVSHGGDADPNEIRRRLGVSQTTWNPSSPPGAPHGGNTDPNELRMRQRSQESSMQYSVSSSSTLGNNIHSGVANPQPTNPPQPFNQTGWMNDPQGSHGSQPYGGGQTFQHQQTSLVTPQPYSQDPNAPMQPPNTYARQLPQNPPQAVPSHVNGYSSTNYTTTGVQYYPSANVPHGVPSRPMNTEHVQPFALEDQNERPHYRPGHERGYGNIFENRPARRWKWPNIYQVPGILRPQRETKHHRDMMQRAKDFSEEDYYLSPFDGHLAKLVVQTAQDVYDAEPNSTWRRTFIRDMSPFMMQVANYVLETVPRDDRPMTTNEIAALLIRWVPASVAILILMTYPTNVAGQVRNGGRYDPFPYRFWGYPYHARNKKEERPLALGQDDGRNRENGTDYSSTSLKTNRPIEPKFLCFLTSGKEVEISDVQKWKRKHGKAANYVFVSYTSEQFKSPEEELLLHDVGEHAARAADVPAYWVGCSCLGDKEQLEENVWLISDVIRGAHSMAIVVSDFAGSGLESPSMDILLQQWGTRVWTLPEVLLSPGKEEFSVYKRGDSIDKPTKIHKRNMAAQLEDGPLSRELIEHYEGSLVLGQLELITVALRCLHKRQKGKYLDGDMSYALMGLLRQRPTIVRRDSEFQAFARLSMANDSNLLLERLICILPKSINQPWHDMDDQWNVALWDIYPTTQVCGIGDHDTVILDNAHAAAIRWKGFAQVASLVRDSLRRSLVRYAFRSSSYVFYIGIGLIAVGQAQQGSSLLGLGAVFLTVGLIFLLLSPYLIRVLYTGKLWATQAWFFGFEGYMDLHSIEKHIFGADLGHLSWSTAGSPLSRHRVNRWNECEGLDPTTDPRTAERVRRAVTSRMGEEKIFTLIDTNTLTVTMFAAVRPPVAVVICGEEGGMQRALLCSYDWATQTLFRETVLRMETPVLDKMFRLGRFRFGMQRRDTYL